MLDHAVIFETKAYTISKNNLIIKDNFEVCKHVDVDLMNGKVSVDIYESD